MFLPATLALLLATAGVGGVATSFEDADYWRQGGQERLLRALKHQNREARARNVIIFIGDGMGLNTVTAARIFQGQQHGRHGEENSLSFEKFPALGLAKTYCVDKQVPDSAATATSILTGVKVNYQMLGLSPSAAPELCDPVNDPGRRLPGLASWAHRSSKVVGVVTTARVTHATPAALYAHSNHRDWECDGEIPTSQRGCLKDIARQLVEDEPGNRFKVILGGGQKQMGAYNVQDEEDSCIRSDGKNLVNAWLNGRDKAVYVNSSESLMSLNLDKVDHLLGLFSPGHIPYVSERDSAHPSLENMTRQAIRVLNKNKDGYVLLVEAARIDMAHHKNRARLALQETVELDSAVAAAVAVTDPNETLILVTADHSHAFTINGYPDRGNDILGLANEPDETSYETLSYANGPGYLDHRLKDSTSNATWVPLSEMKRTEGRYRHLAAVYLETETHGGEDVAVFATGPWAHLFNGVFEQNYIAHAVNYAACIGPARSACDDAEEGGGSRSSSSDVGSRSTVTVVCLTVVVMFASRLLLL